MQEKQTAAWPWLDSRMSDLEWGLSQKEHWDMRGLFRPVVNGQLHTLSFATPVALSTSEPSNQI
jgi:hypothetical protein